jgi:hypothetical protein
MNIGKMPCNRPRQFPFYPSDNFVIIDIKKLNVRMYDRHLRSKILAGDYFPLGIRELGSVAAQKKFRTTSNGIKALLISHNI